MPERILAQYDYWDGRRWRPLLPGGGCWLWLCRIYYRCKTWLTRRA